MADHWKSTPKYWCKFCEIYVRDTPLERKNHESSAKHQNSIQRSLRELHKGQARIQSDQEKAKAEVSRLNKLVGTSSGASTKAYAAPIKSKSVATPAGNIDFAASHRAQMRQLASMGIHVPDMQAEDVAAGGGWQAVPESFVDVPNDEPAANSEEARIKGVHKRKVDDEDELENEQSDNKRKIWGSSLKAYPAKTIEDVPVDIDALLSGVNKRSGTGDEIRPSAGNGGAAVTKSETGLKSEPSIVSDVKQEDNDSAITAPPVVTFKKRKGKR